MPEERQCKDCSSPFKVTENEVAFYKAKGLELPKRCEPCRKLKRNRNNGANRPFDGKLNNIRPRRTF